MAHPNSNQAFTSVQPPHPSYAPYSHDLATTLDNCLARPLSVLQTALSNAIIREGRARDSASTVQFHEVSEDIKEMQQFLEASNCQTRDVVSQACQDTHEEVKNVSDKVASLGSKLVSKDEWESYRHTTDAKLDSILDTLVKANADTQASIQRLSSDLGGRLDALERASKANIPDQSPEHFTLPIQVMPMLTLLVKDLVSRNREPGEFAASGSASSVIGSFYSGSTVGDERANRSPSPKVDLPAESCRIRSPSPTASSVLPDAVTPYSPGSASNGVLAGKSAGTTGRPVVFSASHGAQNEGPCDVRHPYAPVRADLKTDDSLPTYQDNPSYVIIPSRSVLDHTPDTPSPEPEEQALPVLNTVMPTSSRFETAPPFCEPLRQADWQEEETDSALSSHRTTPGCSVDELREFLSIVDLPGRGTHFPEDTQSLDGSEPGSRDEYEEEIADEIEHQRSKELPLVSSLVTSHTVSPTDTSEQEETLTPDSQSVFGDLPDPQADQHDSPTTSSTLSHSPDSAHEKANSLRDEVVSPPMSSTSEVERMVIPGSSSDDILDTIFSEPEPAVDSSSVPRTPQTQLDATSPPSQEPCNSVQATPVSQGNAADVSLGQALEPTISNPPLSPISNRSLAPHSPTLYPPPILAEDVDPLSFPPASDAAPSAASIPPISADLNEQYSTILYDPPAQHEPFGPSEHVTTPPAVSPEQAHESSQSSGTFNSTLVRPNSSTPLLLGLPPQPLSPPSDIDQSARAVSEPSKYLQASGLDLERSPSVLSDLSELTDSEGEDEVLLEEDVQFDAQESLSGIEQTGGSQTVPRKRKRAAVTKVGSQPWVRKRQRRRTDGSSSAASSQLQTVSAPPGVVKKKGRPRKHQDNVTDSAPANFVPLDTGTQHGTWRVVDGHRGPYLWPTKDPAEQGLDSIQCDKCLSWYHYGCVGVKAGDQCLEEDAEFICPPCLQSFTSTKKYRTLEVPDKSGLCGRLDCRIASFRPEKLVGRRPMLDDPSKLAYLVKWQGYENRDSTWQRLEQLESDLRADLTQRLVGRFERSAKRKGLPLKDKTLMLVFPDFAEIAWALPFG